MEKLRGFENSNQDITENRERQADELLNFLETAENVGFLHGQKFDTAFSDEKNKRDFIENLSEKDFTELLNTINGILRNKEKEEWKMDGEYVGTGGNVFLGMEHVSPLQEDKPELLAKVLSAAKTMNQENRELKDIALLVSSSINAIHPYMDANGRTSRFMYLTLSENLTSENKEGLKEIISFSATFDKVEIDINPRTLLWEIKDKIKEEIGVGKLEKNKLNVQAQMEEINLRDIKLSDESKNEDKKLLELLKVDEDFRFLSLFKYLRDNSLLENEEYTKKGPVFNGKNISYILTDRLTENLNQEQIVEILQNYRGLKKRQIEILIDCIANPEKPEYQTRNDDGEKISFKDYLEQEIKKEADKNTEEKMIEAERQKKENEEKQRIKEKEIGLKERFNNGEGDYKFFESSEIKSIQELEQAVTEIAEIKDQEYSEEQKIDILKKSLFTLAGKINSKVVISQEQINSYVENKKLELMEFFAQFQTISEAVDFIEKSGNFAYKIHTSKDYEIPYSDQEYLNKQEDISRFLDDLFNQSVYYVNSSGSSLRLKLFEIKSKKLSNVIQPTAEQIFYNNEMVDYTDKQVIKVSDLSPEQKKFVFEISTPEFRQKVLSQEKPNHARIKSDVGIISDEEGIYVNIPKGATLHSGWLIVGVEKLKE